MIEVEVGQTVFRYLCGVEMELKVSEVDKSFIHCGPWKFLRSNGGEVDEDLGWDGIKSGSYILKERKKK